MDADEIIGVTTEKAARIAKTTVRHVAAWEAAGLVRPSARQHVGSRLIRVYGLTDLVELMIVAQLRDAGAEVEAIRHAVDGMRDQVDRPLSQLMWGHEDRRIYISIDGGETWFDGKRTTQTVAEPILMDLHVLRAVARRAALERDPSAVGRIERRPGVKRGHAVFAGTRIPVRALKEYLERGYSTARILQSFPDLRPPDIEIARRELIGA